MLITMGALLVLLDMSYDEATGHRIWHLATCWLSEESVALFKVSGGLWL